MRHAIKHQRTQMWMFPSCLSAALMASYKDPSLHSHLRRKQEVTPLRSHIKFRNFRKTTPKFTKVNFALGFLFVCSKEWPLSIRSSQTQEWVT